MASNLKYSSVLKTAQQAAISSTVGANGTLTLYSGTQPTNPDTAITSQVALSTHACAATFGTAASGVLTIGSIANGTGTAGAGAGGTTATWFRFTTSGGTAHVDGTVGTSAADLILGSTTIATGQTVQISSFTLTNNN